MTASTLAAEAATAQVTFRQDHEPIFEVEIFAFDKRMLDGVRHDASVSVPKTNSSETWVAEECETSRRQDCLRLNVRLDFHGQAIGPGEALRLRLSVNLAVLVSRFEGCAVQFF